MAVQVEDFLIEQISEIGQDALRDEQYPNLLALIANIRDQTTEEAQIILLNRAGYARTFVGGESDVNRTEIWSRAEQA